MKNLMLFVFLFLTSSISFSQPEITLIFDDDLLNVVQAYKNRVTTNTGNIIKISEFNDQIKKIKLWDQTISISFTNCQF